MRATIALTPLLWLASGVAQSQEPSTPDPQRLREAISRLGEVNGQALACHLPDPASSARVLMLKHSPRTAEFGRLFEKSTDAGFSAQLALRSPCPSARELAGQLEVIALQLRELSPSDGP